jgi:transposase
MHKLAPQSQTCPCRGTARKNDLVERVHQCGCGVTATRDPASALAMLVAGLRSTGREPTWARASEPERVHQPPSGLMAVVH